MPSRAFVRTISRSRIYMLHQAVVVLLELFYYKTFIWLMAWDSCDITPSSRHWDQCCNPAVIEISVAMIHWRWSTSCYENMDRIMIYDFMKIKLKQGIFTTVHVKYAWDSTWHSTWYSILCKLTKFNHSKVKMTNTAISSLPNELEKNKPCRSH
jgi:hypothetical protein